MTEHERSLREEINKINSALLQKTADEQDLLDGGQPGFYTFTSEDLAELRIDSSVEETIDNDVATVMRRK